MQAEQRTHKDAEVFERADRHWVPYSVHGAQGRRQEEVPPDPSDRYAAVDDLADGMVVFEVSSWPYLDGEGRLYFEDDPTEWVLGLEDSQRVIDEKRKEGGITAPARPIRVGDAFLFRGVGQGEVTSLDQVDGVIDISAAARDAAKAALFGAAASTVETAYAAKMAVTEKAGNGAPRAGEFDVGQLKSSRSPGPELGR
ncbi:MAG: hypothetical protein ACRDZM_04560 [Acidimicrobiia bacterium]